MQNQPKPLLIIGDAVSGSSGLSRITRDLAVRIHENLSDVYRLGTAGYGACGSRQFPWPQYNLEGLRDWIIPSLPEICNDFFGKEEMTLLVIWDLGRVNWVSQPQMFPELLAPYPGLQKWLVKRPFKLFGYFPIDASGPQDKLTFPLMKTLLGFDRILAYGQFGEDVIRRTIGDEEADKRHLTNLPHGINSEIFYETNRSLCRKMFLKITGAECIIGETKPIEDDEVLIGVVATNQSRKSWDIACETISILARDRKVRLWCHIDSLERYWSLPSLLVDFGILQNTVVSLGVISDEAMAEAFSACDLTLGIGVEGFGLPLAESLACSTPVITGNYGGASDFVPKSMQVSPIAFRYEGSYANLRPVYHAEYWANKCKEWIGKRTILNSRYFWENLWKNEWEAYLREAAK